MGEGGPQELSPLSESSRLSQEPLGHRLALTLTSSNLPQSMLPSFSIQVPNANFKVSEQLFYDTGLFHTV